MCDEHVKKRVFSVTWMQRGPLIADTIVRKKSLNKIGRPTRRTRVRKGSSQNQVKPTVEIEYERVCIKIWEQGEHFKKRLYLGSSIFGA